MPNKIYVFGNKFKPKYICIGIKLNFMIGLKVMTMKIGAFQMARFCLVIKITILFRLPKNKVDHKVTIS